MTTDAVWDVLYTDHRNGSFHAVRGLTENSARFLRAQFNHKGCPMVAVVRSRKGNDE